MGRVIWVKEGPGEGVQRIGGTRAAEEGEAGPQARRQVPLQPGEGMETGSPWSLQKEVALWTPRDVGWTVTPRTARG